MNKEQNEKKVQFSETWAVLDIGDNTKTAKPFVVANEIIKSESHVKTMGRVRVRFSSYFREGPETISRKVCEAFENGKKSITI